MSRPNDAPEDRLQFWFNIIGISTVVVLLGIFFFRYGGLLPGFLQALFGPGPMGAYR